MKTIKQHFVKKEICKGLNFAFIFLILSGLLLSSYKFKKNKLKSSDAIAIRYVKLIQSPDLTIEFTYDEQNRILSATEKRAKGNANIYTYIYMENNIQVNWNGKEKASITSEVESKVTVKAQEGNMVLNAKYGMDENHRILQSITGVFGDVSNFTWEDGNLVKVKSGYSECVYQYGDKENKSVNIDIVNCINSLINPYPWYYCAFSWGQTKQLPIAASADTGSVEYVYELDKDGYVVKVNEKRTVEMEFGTNIDKSEYTIVYCD